MSIKAGLQAIWRFFFGPDWGESQQRSGGES